MRIAIDGRCVQDHFPGIGRYTYSLCRALSKLPGDHTLLVLYDPAAANHRFPLARLEEARCVRLVPTNAGVFSARSQIVVPARLKRERVDVFHSPYYLQPYYAPAPTVVTLHDVTPLLFPDRGTTARTRLMFSAASRLTIATARRIIAGSQSAKNDFMRVFGLPAAKARVVYHGVDEVYCPQSERAVDAVRERFGLVGPYLLYMGINKPHKNLGLLLRAFQRVARSDVTLALAGPEDPRYGEARQAVGELGLESRVRFLGPVDEACVPALYSGAVALVFPSLYEGFGFPALEAMACGTPVVCSNTSALPEVVGEAAVVLSPHDVEAWTTAIERVLEDGALRDDLRSRGLARASEFTWDRTARATLNVYREAAN